MKNASNNKMPFVARLKSWLTSYLYNNQVRKKVNTCIEVPFTILMLILGKYSVLMFSLIGFLVFNVVLNYIVRKVMLKKLQKEYKDMSVGIDIEEISIDNTNITKGDNE